MNHGFRITKIIHISRIRAIVHFHSVTTTCHEAINGFYTIICIVRKKIRIKTKNVFICYVMHFKIINTNSLFVNCSEMGENLREKF